MIFVVRVSELIAARVTKTASAASSILIKLRDQLPLHDLMAGNDHLSDALAVVERKGLLGEIDHKDLQLTTIIRIDSPRAIGQGNTMLQCKSTTRADLRFVAFGDLKEEARGNKAALEGLKVGIMGCIVNGPGEMADADYGYVGAAPGKIDLYKGQECIKKGVPQAQAVEHLIDLIKEGGDWKNPE